MSCKLETYQIKSFRLFDMKCVFAYVSVNATKCMYFCVCVWFLCVCVCVFVIKCMCISVCACIPIHTNIHTVTKIGKYTTALIIYWVNRHMDRSSTYLDIFLTEIHKGTMKSEKNLKVNHTCKKRHHINHFERQI